MRASTAGSADHWVMDNALSRRWPLYTRGNVGEVFPEVVLPFTWDLCGQAAEDGWRDAFERMGLIAAGDMAPDEPMVILGVFGGYCYINASYVRMLGLRAPGASVELIDTQFFGESDAPPYVKREGDRNLRSTLRLGRTLVRLLRAKHTDVLAEDQRTVAAWVDRQPGPEATDAQLLAYCRAYPPLFRQLFARHVEHTFAVAMVSGALFDLCAKAGQLDRLVSLLGGIGSVDSAEPSSAMWALARQAASTPAVAAAFGKGIDGLLDRLRGVPDAAEWLAAYERFIAEFGSRGPNEWDFGSDPWEFRPKLALAAIDRMRSADDTHEPAAQVRRLTAERELAIDSVRKALNPIDRWQFDRALHATILFSQARERTKTTVIRAQHEVRRAHHVLAARATTRGGPAEAWESCLLTTAELGDFMVDPPAFADTIEARKALHARLSGLIPPFIIDGAVPPIDTWEPRDTAGEPVDVGDVLSGIPGCSGVAKGRARVVLDPSDPRELGPGDVLVAPITDPSWTPLFLAAEAVVVDVGATMSHAVIVSRELGIPCVVSAVGATRSIPDGALIEVDGGAGTVTVLEVP
jgi:pyruvate,water dikinase